MTQPHRESSCMPNNMVCSASSSIMRALLLAGGYKIFYGLATPPTSYGGYGGNAAEAAKYTFEYPSAWKSEVPSKVQPMRWDSAMPRHAIWLGSHPDHAWCHDPSCACAYLVSPSYMTVCACMPLFIYIHMCVLCACMCGMAVW